MEVRAAGTEPDGELHERGPELACLERSVAALHEPFPQGHCVLLEAPSGYGKTSLLREARRRCHPPTEWLWASCEPLQPAPALGALLDLLDALPGSLAEQVRGGRAGHDLALGLLGWLRAREQPLVLVIDDLQWADGATLDVLRYLARRIDGLRLLLLLSRRLEPADAAEPSGELLASLPPHATTRMPLAALSEQAVEDLARRAGRPAEGLHRVTGGHPFFVAQVLASPPGQLPGGVRDAVLALARRLPPSAREVLDRVSLSPGGLPLELLPGDALATAAPALASGLLVMVGAGALGFRHEIARRAVEAAVPAMQALALHRQLYQALTAANAPLPRRVHHAQAGGLEAVVAELAPQAADAARRLGAHRQAAQLLGMALQSSGSHAPRERAALEAAAAEAWMAVHALDEAHAAWSRALELLRQDDDRLGQARCLRELGRVQWYRGSIPDGLALVQASLDLLEGGDAPAEQWRSRAALAHLHLLGHRPSKALAIGEPTLAAFEAMGDVDGVVYVLNTLGAAEVIDRDAPRGWQRLRQSLALALEHGMDEHATRAYVNLASSALIAMRLRELQAFAEQGLAWCTARDQDQSAVMLRIRDAFGQIHAGRWPEARVQLQAVRAMPRLTPRDDEASTHALAILDLREGRTADHDPWPALMDGRRRLRVYPWFIPDGVFTAEAAWLRGDARRAAEIAAAALPQALAHGERGAIGRLACWMHRGRVAPTDPLPPDLAAPFRLELAGDVAGAAQAWRGLGHVYDQGLTLLGGDAAQVREGIALLLALGAQPAVAIGRQRLGGADWALGSGPRRHARDDPLGLTARERQVYDLLRRRLSNADIAARLHRSERTVEKHVAAVLAKLGLASRIDLLAGGPAGSAGAD